MRFIEGPSFDPAFNLAVEEYLFRTSKEEGCFLLWRNGPSVIIGRFQNAAREVNRAFVEERGIKVVRRLSGGGAVYHDLGNLNYTFIVPNDGSPFDFAKHAAPVVKALAGLGVEAAFSGRNDLTIKGLKFSGNAQHMDSRRLLHHGTLLFDSDLSVLGQALNVDTSKFESKGFKSVRSRVTNILPHLSAPMAMEDFIAAIRDSLPQLERRPLAEAEVRAIEKLRDEKYSTWEWNWGESPDFTERKERRFSWGKVEALLTVERGIIVAAKFYGDFFSLAEPEELGRLLAGCPLRKEDLKRRLSALPLDDLFRGADEAELAEFLAT
ncbi:MAG: lipoate--protein ligase [Synergistaceae bacterium]|nr:lipoate--protein ligase [Synergistaceae bacterium]